MRKSERAKLTGRIALLGVLGAQALALSFIESLLPPLPGMPPGAKPGFSNIVTMYTVSYIGTKQALLITLIKAIFAGLTRGPSAFMMSLAGGLLSTFVMASMLRISGRPNGIAGISVASAAAHNMGQLLAAMFLLRSTALVGYLPVLIFFSVATGLVTGTILKYLLPALDRQSEFFLLHK
ncbi:MAG: Gx transporter family protein [Clostridiales bacterium]|jgi:heptaprenyl diphosphate synthase|nr:Gx transporter family protein [Clostridiales bacterium]